VDIVAGAFFLAGAFNLSAITGASWFPLACICIFIGMYLRKFL
jgi:hypothetical protein